ncbi:hypothetical protein LOTGIDRAFT_230360 [Lottia gigantea]|uniref:CDK5 regulatory subunit-associated protein 3 n=1 Tax=Lottia gigantea TaxID=225164 RepID=V4AFS3_LOTGI|nr:hypothetical protein LOTGIDRAFT_230360 [Lottia gigantea]ESP02849.1 hypothetical protein LOTGIDRAFT_230360 [Lottia gigantea]
MADQRVEDLPIDIHYNKLLDWLINRRHCNNKWQGEAMKIKEKLNKTVKDIPDDDAEISDLITDQNMNYFHCLKIVEKLKSTDSGKTNFLGQYSSKKMQDWASIIKMYEKDGIYLAECAQILSRNVNYEIPALKKQIGKCHQIQEESKRKERDYFNNSVNQKKNYEASCKKMGIEGKKIKTELAALVRDLPSELNIIAKECQKLDSTISYYDDFISHIMSRDDLSKDSLQALKHVIKKGNTTTYEWKMGKKPVHIDETSILIDTSDENDTADNTEDIDWGGDVEVSTVDIDFSDQIDFGDIDITVESGGDETSNNQDEGGDINWDIDTTTDITSNDSSSDGVASGENALSILENPATRNLFLDDLFELEAFLCQRLEELQGDSSVLSDNQFQSSPESIQLDASQVSTLLSNVNNILTQLTNMRIQQLLLIRNSPRYVNRVHDNLKQILLLADKMTYLEKQAVIRRNEALEEQQEVEPKLDTLIKRTKQLQKQLEGEISKKYKERKVNIMGDINTI